MSEAQGKDGAAVVGSNEDRSSAGPSNWDIANVLDQCVSSTIGLLCRIMRTLLWIMFRPRRLAEQLASGEFQKSFCPPLAFLALGILCGFALLHDVWTLSPESVARLAESESGWVAWIAHSLVDQFRELSLSSIVIRTMPTVIVTVLVAAAVGRCLAGRVRAATLASAICLVIGFRLFLRLGQGLWHLGHVYLAAAGETIFTPDQVRSILAVVTWAYLAAMVYILLFAGVRFLTAAMQRSNRGWLASWPVAAPMAWSVTAVLFLGTFIAPAGVWNAVQIQNMASERTWLKSLPLGPARLDFSDEQHVYLAANILVRNESERQFLVAMPAQILIGEVAVPVDCNYEADRMLDGTCLLDARATRVVRVTWRLGPEHVASVVKSSAVPLIFQLGSVDDVMAAEVQSSTLQIAIEPNLLAELSTRSVSRVAELDEQIQTR